MKLHLVEILEINHHDINGKIIYQEKNINNIIHKSGEEFILKVLFGGLPIPNQYHLGLDSRSTLNANDVLSTCASLEPVGAGYSRQSLDNNNFTFITNGFGDYQANSPAVLFKALGGSWGPVKNVFLTTVSSGSSGYLISSIALGSSIILSNGETVSLRIGLALKNTTP